MAEEKISLCLPVTPIGQKIFPEIRNLLGAIEYKNTDLELENTEGLDILFESPYGVIADEWMRWVDDQNLFSFLTEKEVISYSCDLGPACRRYKNEEVDGVMRSVPDSDVLDPDKLIELAKVRMKCFRSHFSGKLKFEIYNFFPTGVYDHVCEPEFMKDFLQAVDGELLLDLGHARVSAENLDRNFEDYLRKLPLDTVSEIHFSKAGIVDGHWEDTHECPEEEDYKLLEKCIELCSPKHIVVEYYKDSNKLIEIYQKLNKILC